jgi:putative ABC transport system permease protein
MDLVELLFTAVDTIRASKVRAFLTTLGVIIGVLAVILLVALGDGARQYLADQFAELGSNVVQIIPGKRETQGLGPPVTSQHRITREDEIAIARRAYAIEAISGIVNGAGAVKNGPLKRDTYVFGVGERFSEIRGIHVDQGRFFAEEDIDAHRRYVVLGRAIVADLFGDQSPLGRTVRVAEGDFRVIGVLEHKGTSLGFDLDDLVIIPSTTALDLFALEGFNTLIARAKDRANVSAAIAEVSDILKRRHNDVVDFTIVSQDDILGTLNAIMDTMTMVLLAIASIALVVGGIGIANIMLVSVRERTREIGVRRAVGATRGSIMAQFLVEAIVISILGGLIGLALGASVIGAARAAVPALPVRLSGWIVAVALGFSAAVGVLSGVIPARRAANLDPVEALRYE